VKDATIKSFRSWGRQLLTGIATVQLRRPHLTWACGDCVITRNDSIIVLYIATSIFEIKHPASSTPNRDVAILCVPGGICSRYAARESHLDEERHYKKVEECVGTSMHGATSRSGMGLYLQLVEFESLSDESSPEAGVVKMGSRLGKELVEDVERLGEEDQIENPEEHARCKDEVWKLLAESMSDMILHLASSDNVKGLH
jgi:hypothetical protein